MTEEQIKYSIEKGELKLGAWDKFTHYSIVGFMFLFPLFSLLLHIVFYFQGKPKSVSSFEVGFFIAFSILGILFYRLQRRRLKFEIIETQLKRDKLNEIIDKVAKKLEWSSFIISDKVIIAKTFPSFLSGSWGEQITILFDGNRVLVNSICDPDKKSSVVSMGRNRKNVKTLIDEIKKVS